MIKDHCKHYNGLFWKKKCKADILYKNVIVEGQTELNINTIPCLGRIKGNCSQFLQPTDQEIREYESKINEHARKFMLCQPLIGKVKKDHKGEEWYGIEICPICKGKLRMSHAKLNGHVHGKCETGDCIAWME